MKKIISTILLMSIATLSLATTLLTPEGKWKTIDDETGEAKSIVSVWIDNGELKGRIDTILNPTQPNPTCDECKGSRKDQAIEGMTFVWGLGQDGDEWNGGTILDPSNGKEYKAKLKVIEGGQKLEVRGFIGFPLLGRTQIWERAE